MSAHEFGDPDGDTDDDPTRPEGPGALLSRTIRRFSSSAASIANAVPLLESLEQGSEREYFAAILAADIDEFAEAATDLATYVRSRAR